jgi:cyclic pyranopterin phosphate synthase
MPEMGVNFRPKSEILTFEEIRYIAKVFYDLGVRKFRLTGGEPLSRKDSPKLVTMLRSLGEVEVHMTTNGYFLPLYAKQLKEDGLTGLNISLDSLRPERVFQITRRHYLPQVLRGIEAAKRAGIPSIKINTVLIRGLNDDEIGNFAAWTKNEPFDVRFIEYMPYKNNAWEKEKVVRGQEVASRLQGLYPHADFFHDRETSGVSTLVRIPGHKGAVGFIDPMSDNFCHSCNRVRLTAEGQLLLCLFSEQGTDLKTPIRTGTPEKELREFISRTIFHQKPKANPLPVAENVNVARHMVEVGG